MFKNIQKYLLLNHPLLWNTKIIPMTIILLIINLIFFGIGFYNGKIDFTETNNNYSYNKNEPILVFVGILISLIIIIVWLVFYFKNNAFKSFYPKNNNSLFKEWMIIFLIMFMTSMFALSYLFAKEVRVRNYFTKSEAIKRSETISLGSVFLEGSFASKYYDTINQHGDTIKVLYKYSEFKNKRYELNSLMNKNIESNQFFDIQKKLFLKEKTQNWLYNQDKIAIKSMFKDYLAIVNEHHLKANIDENKWFDLIYNAPNFTEINIIGKAKMINDYNNYYSEAETTSVVGDSDKNQDKFDYLNKFRIKKKGYFEECFKNYVPAANLNFAYEKIAEAWISPEITAKKILFPIYFAFGFSLLIFSFRVTSGRNWLISSISLGIINIILGIFSVFFSTDKIYLSLLGLLILILFIYFTYISNKKREKNISAITLNGLLWLFGGFIPLTYYLLIEFLKWKYDSNDKINYFKLDNENRIVFDLINLLKDDFSGIIMTIANLFFMFIFMYFMLIKIKKWRGIPEN